MYLRTIELVKGGFRKLLSTRQTRCFLQEYRSNSSTFQVYIEMDKITALRYEPLPEDSPYVKPFRMYYTQNGEEKSWDLLKVHDSVAIIIFNKTSQKLLLVKQFRPAVYHGVISSAQGGNISTIDLEKYPPQLGITLELCAGIVDKSKALVEIAQEEVLEECGYNVPVERIESVLTYRSGVGATGALQNLYYCEVTDGDKVNSGGGVDGEIIDVVELGLEDARQMLTQGSVVTSPPSCLLGILWFLTNKLPKH
ncbi:uridine diphosphate glucose pyrophosphatase NUDT14-like [Phlebotomus argentipes]|uniref:uridine diphosphate glucose pyrophosphatase NUDT14-like n=1 Tax=Phlebotomus argentipes TaxID=94469 RepID=UPI002892DB61|nr:uridine diphosphate glucose pyrophosphatase NUDT14-like [Phlebotomus argentipes]